MILPRKHPSVRGGQMSSLADSIKEVAAKVSKPRAGVPSGQRMAELLQWTTGTARTEKLKRIGLPLEMTRALVGDQPAALFVGAPNGTKLLDAAALFAYHSSIEWGLITDA